MLIVTGEALSEMCRTPFNRVQFALDLRLPHLLF